MEGVKFDIFSDEIIDKPIPDSIEINFDKYSKMAGAPYIKKMGAVCPNGESTPFVWDGRYMRLEKTDNSKGLDLNDPSIGAIIRDVETGKIVSRFAQGCYYHSGFLDGGTFYVLATVLNHGSIFAGDTIKIFSTKDLINWDERILFSRPGFAFFNTSLTKSEKGYVLAIEINSPSDWAGQYPFTCMFLTSANMQDWRVLPKQYTYPKNRYCGGPFLTYDSPYYYLFLVTELPLYRYNVSVVRSTDLLHWEVGKYFPFLTISAEDRLIAPYAADMDPELLREIPNGFLSSLSDIDMCEYDGKTRICYNVGNQLGYHYLCEAEYDGTLSEFLQSLFR